MSLTLSNPTLAGTVDATELNDNFSDITNKFSGNIINADISSSANIAVSKLAASKSEIMVTLKYRFPDTGGSAFGSLSDGAVADAVPLAEDDGATALTLTNAQWVCNDTGAGTCTFDIRLGYYDSAGAFQTSSTLVAEEVISNANANNDANNADCTVDSAAVTLTRTSSRPLFLALTRGGTGDAGTVDSENDFLTVSLRLTREIQAS